MRGNCNCGNKATSEWIIKSKGYAINMYFCDICKPKQETINYYKIAGK